MINSHSNALLEQAYESIKNMKVRGAGQIARFAVNILMKLSKSKNIQNSQDYYQFLNNAAHRLISSRPTAVSLPNGIRYVMNRVKLLYDQGEDLETLQREVLIAGKDFVKKSHQAMKLIAQLGSQRVLDNDVILTHCNSSVVISILKEASNSGKRFKVYVTETRPRYQGRLTARELIQHDIPCIYIVDSAVRYFINKVDKVMVGADVITASGNLINKIGTSMIALSAHEARVTFLVAAETYKFSPDTVLGELVSIEERPKKEVLTSKLCDSNKLEIRNPSFDVTPSTYIDEIITEVGIFPPQAAFWVLEKEYQTYNF